jgi:hypothetical protein
MKWFGDRFFSRTRGDVEQPKPEKLPSTTTNPWQGFVDELIILNRDLGNMQISQAIASLHGIIAQGEAQTDNWLTYPECCRQIASALGELKNSTNSNGQMPRANKDSLNSILSRMQDRVSGLGQEKVKPG